MDNWIIRFYNQNRKLFWTVILTIIAVIALIQILNKFAEKKINLQGANRDITYNRKKDPNYAIISENKVDSTASNVISFFINYCNNGRIQNAYDLLSDDCKEVLYPSLEKFIDSYYNKVFKTKKLYKVQALVTNENTYTFQIDFTEDILATGKIPSGSIIDYYTVVNNNRRL